MSGNGTLVKNGTDNLFLSGSNTFSGGTTLNTGTLTLQSATALGNGSFTQTDGTSLLKIDTTGTVANALSIYNISALQSSTLTGSVTVNNASFEVETGHTLTISGGISGNGSVVKNGEGTLTLSGNNSYAGGTTVNAGTLVLSGSLATGGTTVNSTGTLAGTGTAAAVTLNSGGIIAPGASAGSVGTLSLCSLTLNGGGGYKWDLSNLSGSPGSDWDLISVSGATTISATSGNQFTIYLSGNPTGWDPSVSQPTGWNIIQWGSVTGFDPAAFALNASFFTGASPTGTWAFANSGGYLNLSYEAPGGASIWDSGAGNWSTGANWQSGSVPTNGSALEFAGVGGVSTNNGALTSVNGLIFSASAGGSYTINGTSLEIGGAGISNASGYNQTVSLDLVFTAAQAFDSGSSNLTVTGAITNANQRLTVAGNGTTSITGAISGTGGLTKTNTGSLVLSANNTFTGTTIISAGTIRLEGSSVLGGGNYSSTIANSGALVLDTSSNQVLSGGISGSGSLVKNNSSILTLSGSNTHSGGTTLNAGTLRINNASALGTGAFVIGGSTTIDNTTGSALVLITNNTQNWNSDFTFTGSDSLDLGTGAVSMNASRTLTVSANTLTVGGAISGSGFSLTKNGAGTLVLSGNNTYTGTTTLNAGTLVIGSTGLLGAGSYAGNIGIGGTFRMESNLNQTFSGVLSGSGSLIKEGSGTLTLSGANNTFNGPITVGAGRLVGNTSNLLGPITNDGELEFSEPGTAAYTSVISGSGSLMKSGSGDLTLSAENTYTGTTTISAGTLTLGASGRIADTSSLNVSGTFNMGGFNETLGSIQGSGSILLGSGTLTTNSSTNTTFSGVISGTGGGLVKQGSGNLTLSGNNNYTGVTTISAGTLTLGASGSIADASNLNVSGTFNMAGFNETLGSIEGAGSIVLGSGTLTTNSSSSTTFSGALSGTGGVLVKQGSGNLTLSGSNTQTGGITVTAGRLLAGADTNLGGAAAALTLDGGTFAMTTAFDTSRALILGSSGGTLDTTAAGNSTFMTLSGVISGNGSLTIAANGQLNVTSPGRLMISGTNTFTGNITITSGVVGSNSVSAFGNVSNVIVLNGGGLLATTQNITVSNDIALGATGGTFRVWGGGSFLINSTISGIGKLDITDSGSVTLAKANTFTGNTRLMNATSAVQTTLNLAHVDALSSSTLDLNASDRGVVNFTVAGNNTYNIGGLMGSRNITSLGGNTISLGGNDQSTTYSGTINGTGGLAKAGNGTLTLSGSNTYTGGTTVNSGTLVLGHATNTLADTGAVTINGGVLSIGSNSDTVGAFTLAGGSLIGTTGTLSASSFTFQNGTVSAILGGAGSLTKSTADSLTLSTANSFSGGITLANGTLILANTNAPGSGTITQSNGSSLLVFDTTGTITNNMSIYNVRANQTVTLSGGITVNNATFDVDDGDTLTISGGIAGSGGVTKNGAGTLVLSGDNSFTGATTVNTGTLQATAANALGSTSSVVVNTGGSLLVTAGNSINNTASVTLGGGTLSMNGTFNESVGALTLAANSIIDLNGFDGTLTFSSVGSWEDGTTLSITNWNGVNQYGTPVGSGIANRHVVFTNTSGLASYLDRISFYSGDFGQGFAGTAFEIGFTGEIAPVPEPETWATGALLLLWTAFWARRKYRRRPTTA